MIRLFHVSDLHFGAEDRSALRWFRGTVLAEQPDAVIVTGDLTMRARHSEFAAAQAWIASLNRPVTIEVGNHDLPYFNPWERFTDPYRRYRAVEAAVETEIDLPGVSLVPLKSTRRAQWRWPWSHGNVSEKALARTVDALDALPEDTMRIVTVHHPLREADSHGRELTIGGRNALDTLARRGVTAILSGHVHDPFDIMEPTAAGPIRMIGAGTLSERVRTSRPSFNALEIASGHLTVTVRVAPESV